MIPANEQSLGRQLLQTLNGYFKIRAEQTERRINWSEKGGYGARKRRKKMRAEAARQRLTPQVPTPPPSTHPPPFSALTTNNNDSELVTGTNNFIFRQLGNLDQLLSAGLGIQTDNVVNMDTIFGKVRELIKENNDMRNFFWKSGKIQPSKICANQHISVATQTPPMARPGKHTGHARSGAQDSVVKASQTLGHHFPVAEQQAARSANSGGRGASKLPGHDPTVMHEASEPVAKVSKLQEQVLSEKFHSEFCEKDWYWNDLPMQKAYELMQQFAVPGHYLVLQCDTFIFRIIWKAGDDNIKSMPCYLWHFIKENTFDDATWNHTVQSVVQESTDDSVFATPLPGKETHRKISQKRHFSNLKKMVFCGWCQKYQDTLHWCYEVKDWFNIDQGNLLFIRGKTRTEASRNDFWTESGSRARTFPNRNNMLLQLYREAEVYWVAKERTRTREWFEENKKDVEKMNESQIIDKYKRCFNNFAWSEVVEKTLHTLIAEMKIDIEIAEMKKEQKMSANAPKLVKDPDDTDWNNRMKRFAAAREIERRQPIEVTDLERIDNLWATKSRLWGDRWK